MPAANRRNPIVRTPRSRGTRAALCFLVFAATVAAIWTWGPRRAERPTPYSAVASVVHTIPAAEEPKKESRANFDQFEEEILSDANLGRLLDRLTPPQAAADSIEALRRQLDVTVSEIPSRDQLEITVACRGDDPTRVVGVVNELATMVADDHRRALAAETTEAWRQAHRAAAEAHEQLLAARSALESFLAEHFENYETLAEKIKAAAEPQPLEPKPVETQRTIANPEWVELDRTRRQLSDRREELLTTRMLQHPMIRELDAKILRIEQELASVPREIPDDADSPLVTRPLLDAPRMQPPTDNVADAEPTATFGRVLPAIDMIEHGPAAEKYRSLCAAADEAQETFDRLAEAEQAAAQARLATPKVELRLAQQCQETRVLADGSSRLLVVALVAGLALAAGAGMISTGLGAQPPLRTISQAQAALPAPIVGVVPSERVPCGDSEPRPASGRMLAIWGLILVAICLVWLAVYLS